MYHVISTNLLYYNQFNTVFYNQLKIESISHISSSTVKYSHHVGTIRLRVGGKYKQTFNSGLKFLWYIG